MVNNNPLNWIDDLGLECPCQHMTFQGEGGDSTEKGIVESILGIGDDFGEAGKGTGDAGALVGAIAAITGGGDSCHWTRHFGFCAWHYQGCWTTLSCRGSVGVIWWNKDNARS
jgi:hypothetical protein